MAKYVEIYYDKKNKTQRFVLCGADDCSVIEKKLKQRGVQFTGHKFLGRYVPLYPYKEQTYKYAEKWQWLNTIDISKGV